MTVRVQEGQKVMWTGRPRSASLFCGVVLSRFITTVVTCYLFDKFLLIGPTYVVQYICTTYNIRKVECLLKDTLNRGHIRDYLLTKDTH